MEASFRLPSSSVLPPPPVLRVGPRPRVNFKNTLNYSCDGSAVLTATASDQILHMSVDWWCYFLFSITWTAKVLSIYFKQRERRPEDLLEEGRYCQAHHRIISTAYLFQILDSHTNTTKTTTISASSSYRPTPLPPSDICRLT